MIVTVQRSLQALRDVVPAAESALADEAIAAVDQIWDAFADDDGADEA